jgi:indolepyruvate ferredoxin oxidoreductase beta subunit
MSYNILLCGVGGQGTVLASKLLAATACKTGITVHSAETIGMAQRGGPVTSHVRLGEDAYAPLIPKKKADLIIAFEPAEAVRNLGYLKKGGAVIVNSTPIKPVTESLHPTGYDGSEMTAYLKGFVKRLVVVDAKELCKDLGSAKFFNVAVLGLASGAGLLSFTKEDMLSTIETTVKEAFVEVNKKAFLTGLAAGEAAKAANPELAIPGEIHEMNKRNLTDEEEKHFLAVKEEIEEKRRKAAEGIKS